MLKFKMIILFFIRLRRRTRVYPWMNAIIMLRRDAAKLASQVNRWITPMSMPKLSQENFGMAYESGSIKVPRACPWGSILFFILLFGCAVVPITGRKQLSFVSNYQLVALSDTNYKQLLKESNLSQEKQNTKTVQEVGSDIAKATEKFLKENGMESEIKSLKWEFNLIEDDEKVNAFAMPGGKIAVYTGILKLTKDRDGLATVVAHEIAHVLANHGGERISQMLLVELGGATLSEALNKNPRETNQIWMLAYGLGANIGIILPYSRTQELEADRIGLILMAKAGYDPRAAIPFWERMNKEEKSRPLEFLSTHPVPERRIEDIRKSIPEASGYY